MNYKIGRGGLGGVVAFGSVIMGGAVVAVIDGRLALGPPIGEWRDLEWMGFVGGARFGLLRLLNAEHDFTFSRRARLGNTE